MHRSVRLALLAALLAAPACGGGPGDPDPAGSVLAARVPAEGADIIGTITRRRENDGRVSVLVEQDSTRSAGYGIAWVYVLPQTQILREADGRVVRARASELTVGTPVRAWFTGPVRESYPVQADAAAILIVP
jgi:hypothetical protein